MSHGDPERFPVLGDAGRGMLAFLREHPHAPMYRDRSGHKLTAEDVAAVRAFEAEVAAAVIDWRPGAPPPWVADHLARCHAGVPFHRRDGAPPARFDDAPPTSRADLAADIAAHVPDALPLARLIQFSTTGTSGHPLLVPSHPRVAASYLAFHRRALRRFGVELASGPGQVAVVLLGFQRRCFTYVSVTPTQGEAGLAKINLHPDDWRDPDDRVRYLDALAPEVIAGDPHSFAELLALPLAARPRALLSTAMALLPGLRRALEERFACPVLDLYSMNEAGPIAVYDPAAGGHVLLQHRLYVEILDPDGRPCPPGVRGEIALTGGFNPYLPLVRYRTGDHAALVPGRPEPVLVELAGRRPVRFRAADGRWVNNIEITHALGRLPLAQFALHQAADGRLTLRVRGGAGDRELAAALAALLGPLPLAIERLAPDTDKVVQYASDLAGAEA